jgi:hypothetical protein
MSDGTLDLLSWPNPLYRRSDPDTCREAAQNASCRASFGRTLVLTHLAREPLTDFQLAELTGWQPTSIGKRRGECMSQGWVEPALGDDGAPLRRQTPSKSFARVWRITTAGRQFHAAMRAA